MTSESLRYIRRLIHARLNVEFRKGNACAEIGLDRLKLGPAFHKRSPFDVRTFSNVCLVVSLTGNPRRSRKSEGRQRSKRNQKVTRASMNYWPGLISMLTTLWVAVLSRLGLVLPRSDESRFIRLLRGSDRPRSSPIRYRSARLAAVCLPHRRAPWSWCSMRTEDRSRSHLGQKSEQEVRSFHGVDPPADIAFLTGTHSPDGDSVALRLEPLTASVVVLARSPRRDSSIALRPSTRSGRPATWRSFPDRFLWGCLLGVMIGLALPRG